MNLELVPQPSKASTRSVAARWDSVNNITDDSMLRGVPCSKLLHRFGEVLSTPPRGSQYNVSDGDAEDLYNKSCEVQVLDWFISHSWSDGRWAKVCCILFVLNHRAMVFCMHGAAAFWFAMTLAGMPLPKARIPFDAGGEPLAITVGLTLPVAFVAYFIACLYAHLIGKSSRNASFFLDKCCIHQADPVRKAAGIVKLGGFLHKSRRMLVLWSPGYFTRLWCVYEVACYSSLIGWQNMSVMPLHVPILIMRATGCIVVGMCLPLLVLAYLRLSINTGVDVLDWRTGSLPCVVCTFICSFIFLRFQRTDEVLREQIKNFTIADTDCYCCSVAHRMPGTGTSIPCDRQFVERNIKAWFGSDAALDGNDGIHAFERHVQESLGGLLQQSALEQYVFITGISLVYWLGMEASVLASPEDGIPKGFHPPYWLSSGFIVCGGWKAWTRYMRGLTRIFDDQHLCPRPFMFDVSMALFFSLLISRLFYGYVIFSVSHRQDLLLLLCVAVALFLIVIVLWYY